MFIVIKDVVMHKVFEVTSTKRDTLSEICSNSGVARPIVVRCFTKNDAEYCRFIIAIETTDEDKIKSFEERLNKLNL